MGKSIKRKTIQDEPTDGDEDTEGQKTARTRGKPRRVDTIIHE